MKTNVKQKKSDRLHLHYLSFLTQAYVMFMVFTQVFFGYFLHFLGYDQDAGILLFPVAFFLISTIAEIYGYQQARRAIWCGCFFMFSLFIYSEGVVLLPSPSHAIHNHLFNALLSENFTILIFIFTSIVTNFIAIYLVAKSKLKYGNFPLRYRLFFIVCMSIGIQIILTNFLQNQRVINHSNVNLTLIVLMLLPIFSWVIPKIKRVEHLDIYDTRTYFNPLLWQVTYTNQDNKFDIFNTTFYC